MTYTLNYLWLMWYENVGNPKPANIYCFSRLAFRLRSSLFTALFLVKTHFVTTATLRTTPGSISIYTVFYNKTIFTSSISVAYLGNLIPLHQNMDPASFNRYRLFASWYLSQESNKNKWAWDPLKKWEQWASTKVLNVTVKAHVQNYTNDDLNFDQVFPQSICWQYWNMLQFVF